MRHTLILTILLTVAASAGCQHQLDLPQGFVKADPGWEYDIRGVSADGVVIGLRSETNPDEGNLAFWSQAIKTELTQRRGYVLLTTDDVSSATGEAGELMMFSAKKGAGEWAYMVAVFVPGRAVLVGEAGGPAKVFQSRQEAIKHSLLTAR